MLKASYFFFFFWCYTDCFGRPCNVIQMHKKAHTPFTVLFPLSSPCGAIITAGSEKPYFRIKTISSSLIQAINSTCLEMSVMSHCLLAKHHNIMWIHTHTKSIFGYTKMWFSTDLKWFSVSGHTPVDTHHFLNTPWGFRVEQTCRERQYSYRGENCNFPHPLCKPVDWRIRLIMCKIKRTVGRKRHVLKRILNWMWAFSKTHKKTKV